MSTCDAPIKPIEIFFSNPFKKISLIKPLQFIIQKYFGEIQCFEFTNLSNLLRNSHSVILVGDCLCVPYGCKNREYTSMTFHEYIYNFSSFKEYICKYSFMSSFVSTNGNFIVHVV
jgi:hypothetical protein